MNNAVDPEHRPGRISRKGMGGWALQIEKYLSILPNSPTQPTLPFSISLENALPTSGCGFYGKNRGPQDGATHIYSLEYINQCESHAFCQIPALNQLLWGILASLNSSISKLAFVPRIAD